MKKKYLRRLQERFPRHILSILFLLKSALNNLQANIQSFIRTINGNWLLRALSQKLCQRPVWRPIELLIGVPSKAPPPTPNHATRLTGIHYTTWTPNYENGRPFASERNTCLSFTLVKIHIYSTSMWNTVCISVHSPLDCGKYLTGYA